MLHCYTPADLAMPLEGYDFECWEIAMDGETLPPGRYWSGCDLFTDDSCRAVLRRAR